MKKIDNRTIEQISSETWKGTEQWTLVSNSNFIICRAFINSQYLKYERFIPYIRYKDYKISFWGKCNQYLHYLMNWIVFNISDLWVQTLWEHVSGYSYSSVVVSSVLYLVYTSAPLLPKYIIGKRNVHLVVYEVYRPV